MEADPASPSDLKQRARAAYERGRVRHALVAALPCVAIAAIAGLIDREWSLALSVGALLFSAAFLAYFRGRHFGRAVLPGVAAGVIPFLAIHVARASGHLCTGTSCISLCIPACVVSGVVAGLLIARVSRRSGAPLGSWAAGGVIAALTGALGCACIGVLGVVGLVVGIVVGSAPLVLRPAMARGGS